MTDADLGSPAPGTPAPTGAAGLEALDTDQQLALTGERTVPGIPAENYWFRRHEIAYLHILDRCAGRDVLEAGSGEGYGAAMIADAGASSVVCVDYDAAAVEHTRRRYPGLIVHQGNLVDLPLADGSVDMVVNFQVIEHLWDQAKFIDECRRVLRPGGRLLISTPNRITFSPGRDTPLNPFHTRELNAAELTELIVEGGFTLDAMLGVHHGPRLQALDEKWGGSLIDAQIARALAGEPWPNGLVDDVAGVVAEDFDVVDARERDIDASLDLFAIATGIDVVTNTSSSVPGQFTFVLHSHLPWLANHGRWPVGEEWLYQSWAASYLPLFDMLERLADDGFTDQFSLGITPVLAAQLDDPHCAASMYEWLADWQLRAAEAAVSSDPDRAEAGSREYLAAQRALETFETKWRHGASPLIRRVASSGVVEILGGPLAHPFAPLLDPRLRMFSLTEGLADARARWRFDPAGIWAPECAFDPGMEAEYARAGVGHFMVDGPTLHGDTALGRPVGDSGVIAYGRDLTVSYRVWSPKSGYPGHAAYRDFHTYDHETGLKRFRVTGRSVPGDQKKPYDPSRVDAVIDRHVEDFVGHVRQRLIDESARIGRDALVVAAFDTELFGHWWHEGPVWLERVLRRLPEVGVRVGTLAGATRAGLVGEPVDLPASSWGSGKDWRVWNGPQVDHLVTLNAEVTETALDAVAKLLSDHGQRNRVADQIVRETLMTVSSDWPFMVSKDTAAEYAVSRAHTHAHATREICDAALRGRDAVAEELARNWARADNLFPALDARRLYAIMTAEPRAKGHGAEGGM